MENNRFSKKIFAILLERAKGDRSWRQFAIEADISYVQMRKLAQGTQENPPRPKLIKKLAEHSFNDIDLEDFMFAVGMTVPDRARARKSAPSQTEQLLDAYRELPARERKTVHDFVTFLSEKQQSKNQD